MPIFPEAPIRLHVTGTFRGHTLDGAASLALDADGVVIAPLDAELLAGGIVRVPFAALDGVSVDTVGGSLEILLTAGGSIAAVGDARTADVAADVLRRGRAMPELTRAVRALGRGRGGPEQEAFFRPLLDARRNAVHGWRAALEAFDVAALRASFDATLADMAASREPERPAARRALEARLCDAAEPLILALLPLGHAARAACDAEPLVALRAWRTWVRAVHTVFDRADAAWPGVHAILTAARPEARGTAARGPFEGLRLPWTR